MPMAAKRPPYQLHLFVVRLWPELLDGEQWEWRGEVKHTNSGEVRYFRHDASLDSALLSMLNTPLEDGEQHHSATDIG
jgi:hypothetical protein